MNNKPKKWVREEQCRAILEKIYCEPFPSTRPAFLVNPETGKCLELDCYNQRLGIACEYNGIQHYEYPNIYHTSVQQFKDQMRRDKFKEKVCKKNNILLIIVPYTVSNLQLYIEERICRYTKSLIKKKILSKIDLTDCTILKDYLTSRLKIRQNSSTNTKSRSKSTKSNTSTVKSLPKKSTKYNTSTVKSPSNSRTKSTKSVPKSKSKSSKSTSKVKSKIKCKSRTDTKSKSRK